MWAASQTSESAPVAGSSATLSIGYLTLLMPAGFALFTCGLVRRKNAAHLVMLNLTAFVCAALAYYAVGYAFQFGGARRFLIGSGRWGVVGGSGFALSGLGHGAVSDADILGMLIVMTIPAYVVVGAICERIAFGAFIACEVFIGALLCPIFGCWVWGGGWLSQLGLTHGLGHGYVDFAGSTVVHASAGFGAMALAVLLGPRLGKYGAGGESQAFPAHNIVLVVAGTLVLLVGWMGFNSGSMPGTASAPLALVGVNTTLAAAAGSAAAMLFWYGRFGTPDISMACNGLLAGLVAIAAPCAFVGPTAAVVIGALAGLLACVGVLWNDRILVVDDPSGAVAVHGYCGWFGAISVGLFANGSYGIGWNGVGATSYMGRTGQGVTGLLYGDASQFFMQLGGATVSALYAFGFTYLVFKAVNAVRAIRIARDVELEGLDLPEFGMLAYPDEGTHLG
jgi:Amt family ammonium transporter